MEIGELFAEKGEPPRYDRSASDNRGSRISPRLVPRPGDVSSGSQSRRSEGARMTSGLPPINGHLWQRPRLRKSATSGHPYVAAVTPLTRQAHQINEIN